MVVCSSCGYEFDRVWRWCPACGAMDRSYDSRGGPDDDFSVEFAVDWATFERSERQPAS